MSLRERIIKILDDNGYKYNDKNLDYLCFICNESFTDEQIFNVICSYACDLVFGRI